MPDVIIMTMKVNSNEGGRQPGLRLGQEGVRDGYFSNKDGGICLGIPPRSNV